MAAILDFPLPVKSDSFIDSTIGMAVIEDGRVVVGILFLSHLEIEICLGVAAD